MLNVKSFVEMVKKYDVKINIPLKKLSMIINAFGFEMNEYCGEEVKVWCTVEQYSKVNDISYKVFLNPNNEMFKGRSFYTSDLVSLINDGIFEMKVKM